MTDKIRVLYVDDEPGLLEIGKLFLEREGTIAVDTQTSASDALTCLITERYDAIISDYHMPDIDGIAFLKQLKTSGNNTPFIIFTGRGREEVVIEALNSGADFYLQKGGETKSQFAELSNKIHYAVTRRRSEEALRVSEERYRSVVNDQTEMIARFTPDGVITFVNEAWYSYFRPRIDLNNVVGKNIKDFPITDYPAVEKFLNSLSPEMPISEIERTTTGKDGAIYWQVWSVHALFGTDGHLTEYQVVGRDITDRKQAEDALQKSEEKYRAIFNNTGAATIIIAPDTTILLANAGWEKLTGMNRADQENKLSWTQFIDKNDVERMKQYHYARRKDPSVIPTVYECRVINANKTVHTCVVHVDMIQGTKNSVASLVDITERRKVEDELQAAYEQLTAAEEELQAQYDELKFSQERIKQDEEKYREIIENIQECYYRTDLEGTLVLVNPSGAVLLGYSSVSDLQGKNIATTLYLNPEDSKLFLAEIDKTGSVSNYEILLKKQDGTPVTILTNSHKYYDTDGKYLGIEGIFRDISERKRAEAALRASEDKFSKTFQSTPDLILLTSIPEGKILEVNESVQRITGYTQEEVQGRTIDELGFWVDDADREQYKARIRAEGKILNFQTRFHQKSGEIITAWISGSIVLLESGPCFINVVNDVTEPKRAEDALKESEEKYRQFFKTTLDSVFMTTPEGKWVDCNDALVEIFGYESREDVFRVPVPSFYAHPEERTAFLRLVERDGYVKEHPMQFRKKNGTLVDGLITIIPWKNPDGSLKGFIGTVHDTLRRKQAEAALRESESRYRQIFESLEDLYYQTDINGLITVLSPSAYNLSGWKPEELIGTSVTDLYINPEKRTDLLEKLAKEGYVRDYELLLRKKDGTQAPVSLSASLITHPDGTPSGISGSLRDITARKYAETAAFTIRKNFEAFFNTIDEFLFVLDEEGRILYTNETVSRRLGYTKEELTGQPVIMVHPPERRDEAELTVQEMLQGIRDFCPVPMMTKEGRLIPVETRVTQGEWDGKPVMFGVSKDISALKLSEEKFSAAFHSNAVLMALSTKADWKFIDVNEAFLETTGFSRTEVLGKSVRELGIFVKLMDRADAIRRLEETGRVRGLEIPFRTKDGSIRNGLFSVESLMIGEVPCLLTTLMDITDRKRAEDSLADRLVFQQALIDSIPYPVFIKDATARFVGCNRAYEQEFGTTRDYMLGKTVLDLEYLPLIERRRFHTEDMEVIATAGRSSYELPIIYADGLTHMTLYSVDGFRLADGRPGGLIGMLVDITDRKRAEEILHQVNKKLTLLSGITRHDINNQLTMLMGYLSLLENKQSDPSLADYFLKISIAAQRISSMIQFTKEYELIGVNAPAWQDCRTLVDTAEKQTPVGKDIVKNDLLAGAEIFADPLIVKVFYNLMDNAVRYGGKITTIRFSVYERDGNQIIVCEDDGEGVPFDEKKRIFDRGFGKNTGLGLALSREILSITGITISENGEPGKGARFEMMVPKGAFRIANMK